MERSSTLSTAEIVGAAAASAAALGSIIVALGRSQASATRDRVEALPATASQIPREGVERGREMARNVAASLSAAYPELRDSASDLLHRAARTAQPHASNVGSSAASTAEHVRESGATLLERLQDDFLPAAATALSGLAERASDTRARSTPAASGIKSAASAKADVAISKSTSAAKDTLAMLAWTATASALVYLVLLSPERREQLKAFLWGAVDQTLVLVRDFQGYDDEF